ncbi:MAG: type II toxin-antitoxin system ParD family antitoxin [Hyphomicrobiaceae bacterium]|nr:type II toxin-antitoxin system ParD family antitoxin [Hyphomicrobiaceae bacterium]
MAVSADLGKPLEDYLNELITKGRYRSRSEVLREGVRLVQEREKRLEALDAAIEEGQRAAAQGCTRPAKEVFADVKARLQKIKEQQDAS